MRAGSRVEKISKRKKSESLLLSEEKAFRYSPERGQTFSGFGGRPRPFFGSTTSVSDILVLLMRWNVWRKYLKRISIIQHFSSHIDQAASLFFVFLFSPSTEKHRDAIRLSSRFTHAEFSRFFQKWISASNIHNCKHSSITRHFTYHRDHFPPVLIRNHSLYSVKNSPFLRKMYLPCRV